MDDLIKIVVITIGCIASIAALIKWGIEKYFQKNEEVLRLKEQMTTTALKSMEKTMDKVGDDLSDLAKSMAELEGHLVIFQTKLNDYDLKSNKLLRSYIVLTGEVRKNMQHFENFEIHEEDNILIFKRKKN